MPDIPTDRPAGPWMRLAGRAATDGSRGAAAAAAAARVAALVLLASAPLHAQTLRGRVLDARDSSAVAGAEVTVTGSDGLVARVVSDSLGGFAARLSEAGWYRIRGAALGYAPSDSAAVEVEHWWQEVEVVLMISAAPLPLEGLTVVARGIERRHQATYGGFLDRHQDALRVGPARVVSRDDPEMRSGSVRDVMRWFPEPLGCTVVFVDGRAVRGWEDVGRVSVLELAGIEFYRSHHDAPLEFRDGGRPCLRAVRFSVLAIWRRRPAGG